MDKYRKMKIEIIKYIFQGWWNFILDIFSDIKYKKEFDHRLDICEHCGSNRNGICKICHCVVKAKTKSEDSECPQGKWKSIHEQQ